MVGGAAAGSQLRRALPEHHLNDDSKDIVRLGTGLVATISALVLGLLINSASSSFEAQRNEIRQRRGKPSIRSMLRPDIRGVGDDSGPGRGCRALRYRLNGNVTI